jgi:hypothetical protein
MIFAARITGLVAVIGCGLIAFASTAAADVLPAGNYQITTVFAGASFFNSQPPYDQGSLFVTDTITLARAGASQGGTNIVTVNASWSGPEGFGNGCSILANATDFSFSSDLSAAALHTTFTQDLQPCDSFEPLVPDVAVDATWTSPAASAGGRFRGRYACGGYQSEALSTNSHSVGDAKFAFSALSEGFEDNSANLNLNDQAVHVQGSLPDACIALGQKGAGIGPHPAGRYVLTSSGAGFSSTDQSVNVFVRNSTFSSNPAGPTSSTSSETDLFVNVNGAFGCFVLSPSDASISSDLSGATLRTSLTDSTPSCFFGGFPYLPLTIEMTLTRTGPVATLQTDAPSGCFALFFVDQAAHAGGSATLRFSDDNVVSYTAAPSSEIDSSDHTFRISGSTPCTPG